MNRRTLRAAAALAAALIALAALSGCSKVGSGVPEPINVPAETTQTHVFFSTGRSLLREPRVVDAKNVYKATLDELLKAQPQAKEQVAIVQPTAKVLSVKVNKGTATIDWSADVLKFDATPQEKTLAWASILETMGQFPKIKFVSFTVNGKTTGTAGGKDIQTFWSRVSLKDQPWPVLRPAVESEDATGSAATTATK